MRMERERAPSHFCLLPSLLLPSQSCAGNSNRRKISSRYYLVLLLALGKRAPKHRWWGRTPRKDHSSLSRWPALRWPRSQQQRVSSTHTQKIDVIYLPIYRIKKEIPRLQQTLAIATPLWTPYVFFLFFACTDCCIIILMLVSTFSSHP